MKPERKQQLNTKECAVGPVLYWMNREIRLHDNWALSAAQDYALEHKQPLMVVYNLDPGFLGGGYRQHIFKLRALEKIATEAEKYNITFTVLVGGEGVLLDFARQHKVGYVVTDMSPLRKQRKWSMSLADSLDVRLDWVDAHNIVPVWVVSEKREYAARTIRPKLHKLLPEYLDNLPTLHHHPFGVSAAKPIDWEKIRALVDGKDSSSADWIVPGEAAAKRAVRRFIDEHLDRYDEDRNNALAEGQSNLSPYLHYGMLSAQYVVLEVIRSTGRSIEGLVDKRRNGSAQSDSASAFMEELVVRRELADNFCFYEPQYDSVDCFPDWAKETLSRHKKDKREYLYTLEDFEHARTHDSLWNAAQKEMVIRGKMHGYMRMYWAKKILEWTPDAQTAMSIAIMLNDRYQLDGRDPNGYAGIAWSIGGVHDRPWFERSIFGVVRYMAESGVAKRFSVDKYCQKWLQSSLL